MKGANAARAIEPGLGSADLFDAIGAFLAEQGLSPDPRHYAFAYQVLTDPGGPLVASVAAITDGGVRLSSADITRLGGEIGVLKTPDPVAVRVAPAAKAKPSPEQDALIARTQRQVEGFADLVQTIHAEARGFGRDLQAGADAIRGAADGFGVDEVMRVTGRMLARIRSAEERLEVATHEAAELRVALEEARENARRDPLTELPNRRAFEEAYAAQSASGARLLIAVCDIDRFKRINDQFGHAVGDRVLKAVGSELAASCHGQLVARYGGEEFAVLFSGADRAGALALLEEARATVAAKRYRVRETDEWIGAVTFSAGLSEAAAGEPLETVFARADALLYAAKEGGRNQLETD